MRDRSRSAKPSPANSSDSEPSLASRAKKWDEAGYHVYDCVAELMPGAQTTGERSLDTVQSLSFLHVDIDLKDIETSRDEALAKLQSLPLPLEIRDSGGGFHVLAILKEPVEVRTHEFDRLNAARKRLTHLLAGDPAPDHAAALLRRLGTRNHKFDPPRACTILQQGEPLDITEIEELTDLLGDEPLFVRKKVSKDEWAHSTRRIETRKRSANLAVSSWTLKPRLPRCRPLARVPMGFDPVIIRAMLLEGWTLAAIRKEVTERTVTNAIAAELPWTLEDEREPVEKRIFSCLQRLYRESYSLDTATIPDWLPKSCMRAGPEHFSSINAPSSTRPWRRLCRGVAAGRLRSDASPRPVFTSSPKKEDQRYPSRRLMRASCHPGPFCMACTISAVSAPAVSARTALASQQSVLPRLQP